MISMLLKQWLKAEGLKLKFNETSWDSMFAGLDAGRFDVIANQVGINPDRERNINFLSLTHSRVLF